jgi:hypothetical protein
LEKDSDVTVPDFEVTQQTLVKGKPLQSEMRPFAFRFFGQASHQRIQLRRHRRGL